MHDIYINICNLIYFVGLRNFVLDLCPGLFTPGLFFYFIIYLVGLRNFVLDHCPGLFTPGLFFFLPALCGLFFLFFFYFLLIHCKRYLVEGGQPISDLLPLLLLLGLLALLLMS